MMHEATILLYNCDAKFAITARWERHCDKKGESAEHRQEMFSELNMAATGNQLVIEVEEHRCGSGVKILPFSSTPRSDRREIEAKTEQNRFTLADRLGWEDFFSLNVWRASTAELLGTAVLVFMVEAIIISIHETDIDAPKLIMAILIAITVAMLVLATIPVSGGHINPIVSFSAGLMGLISLSRTIIYIFAQSAGGVLGALALKAVVDSPGGCTTTSSLEKGRALCLEIICSFVFLFASRWIAFDPRQAKVVGRVIVCLCIGASAGLNVFVSSTVTGSSAAGINPARCLGPAMVRGGHLWDGHWVFWAGPAIASVAFCLYTWIVPDDHFRPKVKEHDCKS